MPFSPCCRRKYGKQCNCCAPCECMNQRQQYPPETTEESDVQLYTPVIAAKTKPANNKCCCCCCCDVKPKRSLWQQLFGDIKFCDPNQKKKQECPCCKPKKKQKSFSESYNQTCCSEKNQSSSPPTSKSHPAPADKPCKTFVCKEVKLCKFKPCSQASDSVFGCNFVWNMGNDCRTKRPKRKCCSCSDPTSSSPTDTTTEGETCLKTVCKEKNKSHNLETVKGIPSHKSVEKDIEECPRTVTKPTSVVKPKHKPDKPEQKPEKPVHKSEKPEQKPDKSIKVEKPSRKSSEFHIGLTITNMESNYYQNDCPPGCVQIEGGSNPNREVDERASSERIITLEIHQRDDEIDKERNGKKENSHYDGEELDSTKRQTLSPLDEENKTSNSREVTVVGQKRVMNNNSGTGSELVSRSREKRENNLVLSSENNLDDRVSEILRRLQNIEKKINNIDLKKKELNSYDVESDGSTISLHFIDGKRYDNNEKNNHKTVNNGKSYRKPHTVIEIRKLRSKSYSPVRKNSFTQVTKYRNSRSLDRVQRDQPKLIIKLPRGNKFNDGFISMTSDRKTKALDYQDSEWFEVSNELKKRKEMNRPCYCYECVCRRVSCGVY